MGLGAQSEISYFALLEFSLHAAAQYVGLARSGYVAIKSPLYTLTHCCEHVI